jgi:hypothetical protein
MSGTLNVMVGEDTCDLALTFGGDLSIDATGDLAVSTGTQLSQDRIYRRLLTNPGNYIWWLKYGGGLANFLGRPAAPLRIAAIARAQMALESSVAPTPPPSITARSRKDSSVVLTIKYADASTGAQQLLTVPVGD